MSIKYHYVSAMKQSEEGEAESMKGIKCTRDALWLLHGTCKSDDLTRSISSYSTCRDECIPPGIPHFVHDFPCDGHGKV